MMNLKPGNTYELQATIERFSVKFAKFTQKKSLILDSFTLKPRVAKSPNIYVLSNTSANLTWEKPDFGSYKSFNIKLYSPNSIRNLQTPSNWIVLNNLTRSDTYQIELRTSTGPEANIYSDESVNLTFSLVKSIIKQLTCKNSSSADLSSPFASLTLSWLIKAHAMYDLCDVSKIKLNILNPRTSENYNFYEKIDLCSLNRNSNSKCLPTNDSLTKKCEITLNNLEFNTRYDVSLGLVSLNGNFEWPMSEPSLSVKTIYTIPKYVVKTSVNQDVNSNSLISIVRPKLDQSSGPIVKSHLYLVKLGSFDTIDNENSTSAMNKFYSLNIYDQRFLSQLLNSSRSCSNETTLMKPCLLKTYRRDDHLEDKQILIGKLAEYKPALNISFDYENISTELIEHSNFYQLFFVYEVGDNINKMLYFATEPTELIRTKALSVSSSSSRDGVALWVIIFLCVVSSLLLIGLIITLIVLTLVKYKPSKFHKAAQIVGGGGQQQSRFPSSQVTNLNSLNLRTKFDRDDYLIDFVPPGEFSRYDMTNIWLVKHANGDLILDEEYRNLPDYRDVKTTYASQATKNESKNRFLDIKAYDDSRVILQVNAPSCNTKRDLLSTSSLSTSTTSNISEESNDACDSGSGDYINANFIQGYSHDKKFIATQGPKKETIVDFWRMIYQYRVSAIVMLTKLVEKGVERCTQYWPDKLNITETYGDFEVTMKDQQKCGDYIKRTFDLIYLNYGSTSNATTTTTITSTPGTLSINNRKMLTVIQYYYPEWPDKETPSTDPISILNLIRDVNANHLPYQYPIVVHCSAGVGRTGTYITLDAMMEKIDTEAKIDIFGFISKIRERRQYLVQTSKQYIFIHEALYEYCLYGFTDIEVSHLVSHFKHLKERSPTNALGLPYANSAAAKTRLQVEFEKICNAFTPNSQAREAFSYDNKGRNRNLNTICYDDNRIRLSSLTGSSYINATKVKGYELHNELIITQDPMANTVFEFWKMITEYNCSIIVALNKEFESETESVYWPTDQEPVRNCELEDTKFVIQLLKPAKGSADDTILSDFITKREFEIIEHKVGYLF